MKSDANVAKENKKYHQVKDAFVGTTENTFYAHITPAVTQTNSIVLELHMPKWPKRRENQQEGGAVTGTSSDTFQPI